MSSYIFTRKSRVISSKPCRLHRAIPSNATATRGWLDLYDGIDTGSGRLLCSVYCQANASAVFDFGGVICKRGLYATLGTGISLVTFILDVLTEDDKDNST